MPEEVSTTTTEAVKSVSDGMVKISIEKYDELLQKISDQDSSIRRLTDQLAKARNEPPIVNRTTVIKTAEMLAKENRAWGNTFMAMGASMFIIGAYRRSNANS
jgi:hypothetical protein